MNHVIQIPTGQLCFSRPEPVKKEETLYETVQPVWVLRDLTYGINARAPPKAA